GPLVWTDKTDYQPGTLAGITGVGFQPFEGVILQVLHADGTPDSGDDHEPWPAIADANGSIQTQWHVCEDDCAGSVLVLTAVGQLSKVPAQLRFTDSAQSVAYLRSNA